MIVCVYLTEVYNLDNKEDTRKEKKKAAFCGARLLNELGKQHGRV